MLQRNRKKAKDALYIVLMFLIWVLVIYLASADGNIFWSNWEM